MDSQLRYTRVAAGTGPAVEQVLTHALLVTGPVTKNMENALKIAYDCTPDPKLGQKERRIR